MNTVTPKQAEALREIRYARNGYNSAVAAAEGYVSGTRIRNLRDAEKRLRDVLWRHRDAIADLAPGEGFTLKDPDGSKSFTATYRRNDETIGATETIKARTLRQARMLAHDKAKARGMRSYIVIPAVTPG